MRNLRPRDVRKPWRITAERVTLDRITHAASRWNNNNKKLTDCGIHYAHAGVPASSSSAPLVDCMVCLVKAVEPWQP